jgi:hypothetical protein
MLRTFLHALRSGKGQRKNKLETPKRQRPLSRALCWRRLMLEQLEDRTLLSINLLGVPSWQERGPGPIFSASELNTITPQDTAIGAVNSVVAEPTGPGTYIVYAATASGGVWRSDNITDAMFNGPGNPLDITWRPLTDYEPTLAASTLALDPGDPSGNALWVGTGSLSSATNLNGVLNNSAAGLPPLGGTAVGLLKTTDGGNTWTVLGNAQLANQVIMRVIPTGHIDATGGGEDIIVASLGTGIWWSANGGQTFQQGTIAGTKTPLTGNATDLAADPLNPGSYYAALPGKGVYWSSDYGQTWILLASNNSTITNTNNLRIAVDARTAPSILWVLTVDTNNNVNDLFEGELTSPGNPTFIEEGPPHAPLSNLSIQASIIGQLALTVNLADPSRESVFVGATGQTASPEQAAIYLVSSGNWFLVADNDNGQPHPDSRSLTFLNPSNPSTLLETDDGGIYGLYLPNTTPDQWISLVGNLRVTEFFSIGYDPNQGLIQGGAQDNGTPQQQFGASPLVWNPIAGGGGGGDGGAVAVDYNHAGSSVIYFYSDGVLRVAFQGDFNNANLASPGSIFPSSGLDPTTDLATYTNNFHNKDQFFPIALDPYPQGSPMPLMFGMTHLYESFDEGNTIYDVTPAGSTGNVLTMAWGAMNDPGTAVSFDPTNPGAAYFSTDTGQLWVRTTNDTGGQFVPVPLTDLTGSGLAAGALIQKIIISQFDYHTAFLLDSNNNVWQLTLQFNQTVNGVFYPVLPTWQEISGKPNTPGSLSQVATIVAARDASGNLLQSFENLESLDIYDPTPGTTVVLVGGFGGVYRGIESGGTYSWSLYGAGLANAMVTDLHYIPNIPNKPFGDILVAGTYGRGAWIVPNASLTLAESASLEVDANAGDTIRLALDAANTSLLDVQETDSSGILTDFLTVPLAAISGITVDGTAGNVTLDVDENPGVQAGVGPIVIPNPVAPNCALDFSGVSSDTFLVDDSLDQAARNITLGTDQITGLGMSMCYIGLLFNTEVPGNLQLDAGSTLSSITVDNLDPAVTTKIDTGFGDAVTVQATAGPVTVNSGSGNLVTVQAAAGPVTINSSGQNAVKIQATTAPVTINSGGPDRVDVGDANGVQDIQGQVSVNNVSGPLFSDVLNIDDTGDRQSRTTVDITDDGVANLAPALIDYQPVALSQLNITGDAISGNIFNVKSTFALSFLGNPIGMTITTISSQAADTINVGDQNGVQDILGKLVINETNAPFEADTLNINDQGDTENRSAVTATSTAVTGLAPATISYGVHDLAALNITGDSAAGGNTFYVLNTAPSVLVRLGITTLVFSTTTTINSNAVDTINVGDQNGVQDIEGSLTINAPFPQDTLNINDQGDASGQKATITSTAVTGLAPATISFALHSLKALNITGDSSTGSNTFNVQSTAAPFRFITSFGTIVEPTITTINSNGPDTITVGDSTNHLDGIQGALTVNGQLGGKTALVLADQGTTTNQVYELSATTVQRLTQVNNTYDPNIALITYNYLANLALYAGSGSTNQMFISSTSSGTTTDVYGGSDNSQATFTTDEFVVAGGAGGATLDAILGALNLHGQTASPGGESYVLLNDSLTTGNQTYTLTAGSTPNSGEVSRTGIAPITFDGLILDELFASENTSAVVNVQSNAANMDTIIASEPGDQVNVGSLAPALGGTMANVLGTVEVTGPGPATLTVDDSGDNSARTVTTGQVSGNPNLYSITGLSQGTIEYTSGSVQSLTIDAPSTPQNGITVNGTPTGTALTVHAGFGNVIAFNVPGIGGPLTDALGVDNTTYLFDGPATDNSRVYTINSNLVTSTDGLNLNIIYPTGAPTEEGSFALFTGNPFTDTINVQSTQAGTSWFLDGAPYNPNVFNIGDPVKGLSAVKGEIEVNSETESPTSDAETVNLNDQPDTNPQTFTFSYDSNQNLNNVSWNGGGFQTGGFLAIDSTTPSLGNLVINAGSGNTTFQVKDLRATNTAITLNGGSGNNTLDYSQYVGDITVDLLLGVATGFSGGISKIENVTGSQGNDLIVGDANPNVLIGGTGRNMIIGGAGADTITGGGGDNILIGGTTLYDTNLIALDALFAEWTSTQSIGQRFQAIRNGISVGGQTYALNKTTVLPDNAPDSLIGGAGINWFFVDSDDTINNGAGPGPSDLITHV